MPSILTSILVLCGTGFLLSGAAEFFAQRVGKPFRNRLLNWVEIGLLVVPFYIHGFNGNELISVASVAVFTIISVIKFVVSITRARIRNA